MTVSGMTDLQIVCESGAKRLPNEHVRERATELTRATWSTRTGLDVTPGRSSSFFLRAPDTRTHRAAPALLSRAPDGQHRTRPRPEDALSGYRVLRLPGAFGDDRTTAETCPPRARPHRRQSDSPAPEHSSSSAAAERIDCARNFGARSSRRTGDSKARDAQAAQPDALLPDCPTKPRLRTLDHLTSPRASPPPSPSSPAWHPRPAKDLG